MLPIDLDEIVYPGEYCIVVRGFVYPHRPYSSVQKSAFDCGELQPALRELCVPYPLIRRRDERRDERAAEAKR